MRKLECNDSKVPKTFTENTSPSWMDWTVRTKPFQYLLTVTKLTKSR